MTLELYKEVALTQDLPDHALREGDIATLVDFVPHPCSGEEGCVLEVFNAIGEAIAVVAVPRSAIKPLSSSDMLSVRSASEPSPQKTSGRSSLPPAHQRGLPHSGWAVRANPRNRIVFRFKKANKKTH
ncbi:DUF4926 domain-containing protein [Pseudanabaena sp. FACHB-2040]|uniref:DUF4926 domain-containing protein n=1 Tax=Pseudanabaena sp. FACHB-2040 TaxID=2692859 RepID=UPI00168205D5|nr:DUF4926 domain-containing protein [Pseudanabaena sp. FACHB-2040]MBD2261140.1 DUF4926 domain-containing protein [Pseudanabaena sp. FACHB-2040]